MMRRALGVSTALCVIVCAGAASAGPSWTYPPIPAAQIPAAQWSCDAGPTYVCTGAGVAGVFDVANNADLSALAHNVASSVTRVGFARAGDSPPVTYTGSASACALNSGAGDGGSQEPTSDGGCWIAITVPFDPLDYGGLNNDTDVSGVNETALKNAAAAQKVTPPLGSPVNAPGCRVVYGPGVYRFTASVSLANTCRVTGQGRDTWIDIDYAAGDFLTINGQETEIDHLLFTHEVARTTGNDIVCNTIRCQIHDIFDGGVQGSSPATFGPFVAIELTKNTTLSVLDNVECRNVTPATGGGGVAGGTCVLIGQVGGGTNPDSDILLNVTSGLDGGAVAPSSGIELKSGDANVIINPNILQAQDDVLFDPASGDGVLDTKVVSGFLDSASNNALRTATTGTGNVVRIWLDGTWLGDSTSGSGADLDNNGTGTTKGFYCNACQIVINGADGVNVASSKWSDISITAGCMGQNLVGIATVFGVNGVTVGGGQKIGTCGGLTANGTGIAIGTGGSSSNWQIQGVNFTGSTTVLTGLAGLTGSRIEGNINYNPVGESSISVTASPFTYTAGPSPETDVIASGSITSVTQGGVTICTVTPCQVQQGPNESIIVTYPSTAPVMDRIIH